MRTRMQLGTMCLLLALGAGAAVAQEGPKTPNPNDIYCSGMVTREAVPADTYVISGEESSFRTTFGSGDYIFVNKGSSSGVKVGDEFQIMRPEKSPTHIKWFEYQPSLMRAMGTQWLDVGRAKVAHVESGVSVALVVSACTFLQRGDIARPFAERPAPALRPADQNRFPAPSGKNQGMVVSAKDWAQVVGMNSIIYVNLGTSQGAKTGDYVRLFRFQGTRHDTAYQDRYTAYKRWGFGKTPVAYSWKDLPREQLGEGIVLRSSENASTVLITHSLREIYMGDYVELLEPAPAVAAKPAAAAAVTPNRPPSLSCGTDRGTVTVGERVRITAQASDPDNDRVSFAWAANAGQLSGRTGSSVTLDTTGLTPGRYTVNAQASDGVNAAVECTVYLSVLAPPAPPQARKIGECAFAAASARVDNVCKRTLDDAAIRLKNDPSSTIAVIGYSDPGERAAADLATARGGNVREYLAAQGIASSRIDVRPATGQTGAGAQNRRVDLIWVPAGATY
ncbi:MAG: OmpA family protein [Acidobacteria bacterium]|nr:OmpA family protein [Acidobacteriota bacterium]MCL5286700.1 OmpA family protein [Acidobacteriota bacterium]